MSRTVEISRFRQGLFELFDEVVQQTTDKVVVERRGYTDRAVLMSEKYLGDLERQLEVLRAVLKKLQARSGAEFRLIGSAELRVNPDEILMASRARQAELLARKRETFR